MSEEEKNGENEIIINIKENNQKSELKLLTLDEYRKKKNLTKFTPKSNKRRIYFQPKINHINHEENIKILQPNNLEIKPDNLKIIEKWKELQKSIKEAISLEELMEEKQMQDNSQLKEKFREYYKVKLECRKEYEIIKNFYRSLQFSPKTKSLNYININGFNKHEHLLFKLIKNKN